MIVATDRAVVFIVIVMMIVVRKLVVNARTASDRCVSTFHKQAADEHEYEYAQGAKAKNERKPSSALRRQIL